MKRVTLADFPGAPLIVVGEQAYTPAEYAAYRKARDRANAKQRERRANDPEWRAQRLTATREWRARHPAYNRDWMRRKRAGERPQIVARYSLHDLRCTGPTKSTGCRCQKVTVYERRAA